MSNPYRNLEERAFWAPSVGRVGALEISDLWTPKFHLRRRHKIVTFGSCFAQHIGRALSEREFNWHITERGPVGLSEEQAENFNYGIFSARTGNIYTASLFNQWVRWALGKTKPPREIWQSAQGRFYDPFRPNIEPNGFASRAEAEESRALAVDAFHRSIVDADCIVFTLGLTESWHNSKPNYEYPMCPGTVAGKFDPKTHVFQNQSFQEIIEKLRVTLRLIKKANPKVKVLLTVSPVPLTATKSGRHVLVATTQSKSILRAVAGQLSEEIAFVDYFPSYEIISSAPFQGQFYERNQREVTPEGVAHVMKTFFDCMNKTFGALSPTGPELPPANAQTTSLIQQAKTAQDVICEEELLQAFEPQSEKAGSLK